MGMSAVDDTPVQPSMRRMREFAVRPDRELGQHFLIDSNILGVIGRAAELDRQDVVLEIGGGLGVLSEYLAERAGHVHVVELDERLRDALLDATGPHANVEVHWGDAMRIDLGALHPRPTKLVANLPFGIAASVLLRTVEELPKVARWVAMAQREVGERLAAAPGSGAYGAASVVAQLACEVRVLRAIPRTVFRPVPNVDSVLVGMRRRPAPPARASAAGRCAAAPELALPAAPEPALPAAPELALPAARELALRELVSGAFAHRRKTLAGSLALSGRARGHSREQLRAALARLGHPPDARAERLSPEDFRELARLLEP
jgi:16S rRNA (adenine1518-N6/adenine1519-N6)-dimethyltransferase